MAATPDRGVMGRWGRLRGICSGQVPSLAAGMNGPARLALFLMYPCDPVTSDLWNTGLWASALLAQLESTESRNLLLYLVPTVNPRLRLKPLGLGDLERNVGFPFSSRRAQPHHLGSKLPVALPRALPTWSFSQIESDVPWYWATFPNTLVRGSGSPFPAGLLTPLLRPPPRLQEAFVHQALCTVGGTGRPEADGHQPRVKWIPPAFNHFLVSAACLPEPALAVSQFHGDSILTKALTWLQHMLSTGG